MFCLKSCVRGKGFSSAHFVVLGGKCERLHGHNYAVECEVEGKQDAEGMVFDFVELKKQLNKTTEQLDHKFLLPSNSREIKTSKTKTSNQNSVEIKTKNKFYLVPLEDVFFLDAPSITAEELAKFIHSRLRVPKGKKLLVRVFETKTSWAEYP